MKTKILLLLILTVIAACSSQVTPEQDIDIQEISSDPADESELTEDAEMDRYARFEAEYACVLAEAAQTEDPEEFNAALQSVESIAEKHGFTAEDVSRLSAQYENDNSFKMLAQEKMMEMCPEIVEQAG